MIYILSLVFLKISPPVKRATLDSMDEVGVNFYTGWSLIPFERFEYVCMFV